MSIGAIGGRASHLIIENEGDCLELAVVCYLAHHRHICASSPIFHLLAEVATRCFISQLIVFYRVSSFQKERIQCLSAYRSVCAACVIPCQASLFVLGSFMCSDPREQLPPL